MMFMTMVPVLLVFDFAKNGKKRFICSQTIWVVEMLIIGFSFAFPATTCCIPKKTRKIKFCSMLAETAAINKKPTQIAFT